ncbi:MAG: acyl-CoA thioesterase, partial [Rhodospirillaceae bacterium]|nr:acyl-CoA thioesterase [Rhodospirillaceae bacterium]
MREYRTEIIVEWAHCDAAGIVFYPWFYTWFDQATERLFSANALSYPEMERDFGVSGMPLLETGATFRNACRLGNRLTMASHVSEWGGKTFTVRHALTHADGRPALEGFEKRVWVIPAPDRPAGIKAVPVPEEVAEFPAASAAGAPVCSTS